MKGGSCIISPLGKVLAKAGYEKKTIIYAEIDLDEIAKGKYDFDVVLGSKLEPILDPVTN